MSGDGAATDMFAAADEGRAVAEDTGELEAHAATEAMRIVPETQPLPAAPAPASAPPATRPAPVGPEAPAVPEPAKEPEAPEPPPAHAQRPASGPRPRRARARRRGRITGSMVAALVVLVLLVVAALVVLSFDPDDLRSDNGSGSGSGSDTTADEQASTTADGAAEVPDGWQTYTDEQVGYTLAYPEGWEVEAAGGPRTDFRDPETGTYLRVDWTDEPKADPVADWQQLARSFAGSHEGYEEVRIEPADYRDYDAAAWEFRYTDGGARLHAVDLGFVAGDRGYALYFQTKDERWSDSQDLFAQLRDSFQP
jgi:hypothetical protein